MPSLLTATRIAEETLTESETWYADVVAKSQDVSECLRAARALSLAATRFNALASAALEKADRMNP